jgi:exosortase/archaeosortase family protein
MLRKGAQFAATLAAVATLAYLALQPLMSGLQALTAQATAFLLGATASGNAVTFAGVTAQILPVCIGDFEIAILVGAIAATSDRSLRERIAGAILGAGFVLAVNPVRIALTLAALPLGTATVELIHSVLFRATIALVVVGFYAAWYLRESIIRRAKKLVAVRKRGFSVFTPMVGLIVITIAILIASSIIHSEKVSMAGTFQSYETLELSSMQEEAQNRIQEKLRAGILGDVTEYMGKSGITTWQCIMRPDDKALRSDAVGVPLNERDKEYCQNKIRSETSNFMLQQLVSGLALEQEMSDLLTQLPGKRSLMTVTFNNVGFEKTISGVGYADCDPELSDKLSDCTDGRMKVSVDYSKLEGQPVAEITTADARLQVFLDPSVREYFTQDPYGVYAWEVADLFSDFEILDHTWNNVGGLATEKKLSGISDDGYGKQDKGCSGDACYGDGSEWYHYTYALQQRSSAEDLWFTAYPSNLLQAANPSGDGSVPPNLADFYKDEISDNTKRDLLKHTDDVYKDGLAAFEAGTSLSQTTDCDLASTGKDYCDSVNSDAALTKTAFPGGTIGALGDQFGGNCLGLDNVKSALSLSQTTGTGIVADTVAAYDNKLVGNDARLKKAVDDITTEVKDSKTYRAAIGYYEAQDPKFRMRVESKQYYTGYGKEDADGNAIPMKGGDNWQCGEYTMAYIPFVNNYDANSNGLIDAGENDPHTTCAPVKKDFGDNAIFTSLPFDYKCATFTMYAVEEDYLLYRNTPQEGDTANENVFTAHMLAFKVALDGYPENWAKLEGTTLWDGAEIPNSDPRYADWEQATLSELPIKVRHCIYEYETGGQVEYGCEWINANGDLDVLHPERGIPDDLAKKK